MQGVDYIIVVSWQQDVAGYRVTGSSAGCRAAPRVLPGDVVEYLHGGRDHLAVNAGPESAELLEIIAGLSPDQSERIHIPHFFDDLAGRAPVGGGEDLDGRDHVFDGGS